MPTLGGIWADTLTFARHSKTSSSNNSHILNLPRVHPVPNAGDSNHLAPEDVWSAFFLPGTRYFLLLGPSTTQTAPMAPSQTQGFLPGSNPQCQLRGLSASPYVKNKKPQGTRAKFHFPSHFPACRREGFLLWAFKLKFPFYNCTGLALEPFFGLHGTCRAKNWRCLEYRDVSGWKG